MQRRSPLHENNQELFDPLFHQDFPTVRPGPFLPLFDLYYLGIFKSQLGLVVFKQAYDLRVQLSSTGYTLSS